MPSIKKLFQKAGWFPSLVFAIHLVLSIVFQAYEHFPYTDVWMHALGGIAIAFFFWKALDVFNEQCEAITYSLVIQVLLSLSLTCSATVFWEFSEFLSDYYFGTSSQLSLEDTLLDMFLGILGGALMISWLVIRLKKTEDKRFV